MVPSTASLCVEYCQMLSEKAELPLFSFCFVFLVFIHNVVCLKVGFEMCAAYYFISFFPIPQPLNLGRYLLSYPVELQDGLSAKLVWCNTKVGGVCVF